MQLKQGDSDSYERVKGYFTLDDTPEHPVKIKAATTGENCLLIPFKYLQDKRGNEINPIAFLRLFKKPELNASVN